MVKNQVTEDENDKMSICCLCRQKEAAFGHCEGEMIILSTAFRRKIGKGTTSSTSFRRNTAKIKSDFCRRGS